MVGIAILSSIAGLLLGGSVGFILGYKEATKRTIEYFEKKLAEQRSLVVDGGPSTAATNVR
jgi:hypothetical protein